MVKEAAAQTMEMLARSLCPTCSGVLGGWPGVACALGVVSVAIGEPGGNSCLLACASAIPSRSTSEQASAEGSLKGEASCMLYEPFCHEGRRMTARWLAVESESESAVRDSGA